MNRYLKMTSADFSPREAFDLALHRWWLIALCVLAGGLLGWGFSRLNAPRYDAQALLVISIDYQQAPELVQKTDDHYTEDQIIGAAYAVVISTYVLDQVNDELQAQGISLDWEKYTRNLASERKRSQFSLRVRDRDPKLAAIVANVWAEKAYGVLVEFHQHAVNTKILNEYLAGMAACAPTPEIEPPENLYPPPLSLCGNGSPAEIQQAIETVTAQLEGETAASKALSPALTFSLGRKAAVPATPSAYRGSLMLAAGALLGCAAGIVAVNISGRYNRRADKVPASDDGN
jgi:capsular polysaccharide biosynthesis protein